MLTLKVFDIYAPDVVNRVSVPVCLLSCPFYFLYYAYTVAWEEVYVTDMVLRSGGAVAEGNVVFVRAVF